MTTLGKVLLVLNLLAVAAFIGVAARNHEIREAWAFSGFRHDLVVTGLPLTEAENRDLYRVLGPLDGPILVNLFQGIEGGPVRTQVDEVKRLQEQFRDELKDLEEAKQRERLAFWLSILARSSAERELVRPRVFGPPAFADLLSPDGPFSTVMQNEKDRADIQAVLDTQKDDASKRQALIAELAKRMAGTEDEVRQKVNAVPVVADLMADSGLFGHYFTDALKNIEGRDSNEQRQAIAHLLFCLAEVRVKTEQTAGKRAQVVLGVPAFTRAGLAQAAAFRGMAHDVEAAIVADRTSFEASHQARIQEILSRAGVYQDLQSVLAGVTNDEAKWNIQNEKRKQVRDGLKQDLSTTTTRLDAALKAQSERERELFEAQRFLAAAVEANLKLEQTIRERERGR